MAARKLAMLEVPVLVLAGLSETQKRAYVIADNKIALNAGWDEEMLRVELEALSDADFDLDILGFSNDELGLYLDDGTTEVEGLTDDDQVPEPPVNPVSKLGDVWLLGEHRLMCGDSTSLNDVATLMAGIEADLLITDPPYNVAYEGGTADALTIMNDNMSNGEFRQFLRDVYASADSVMRPGAAFYIWQLPPHCLNLAANLWHNQKAGSECVFRLFRYRPHPPSVS